MVTEHYVVDAMSFTEAESAIIEHMQPYISGDFKVTAIRPAAYGEVFFSEEGNADRWYKVRIAFITWNRSWSHCMKVQRVSRR